VSSSHKKFIVYLVIIAGAFLLIFVRTNPFHFLKFKVIDATFLPLRIILFPFHEIKKILTYHKTYHQYLQSRQEIDGFKARLIGMDEVILENNRLEQLLRLKRKLIYSSIPANVISRDPSNWNDSIIIDKGREDGIEQGLPVVNALGVVGKIAEVGDTKSKVILITDPSFGLAAVIQRSREIGMVSGTLQGICRMRYLSHDADVQIGDQILTSKLSSSFPEGLLVGAIVDVRRHGEDASLICLINPAVSLSQIEEVLVIKSHHR
jgi:rod shape-determining protein MreC